MHLQNIAPRTSSALKAKRLRIFVVSFFFEHSSCRRIWRAVGHWTQLHAAQKATNFLHRTSLIFIFVTNRGAMNNEIEIQANKRTFKFNTGILFGFTALIMLFSCVFPTFDENLRNF